MAGTRGPYGDFVVNFNVSAGHREPPTEGTAYIVLRLWTAQASPLLSGLYLTYLCTLFREPPLRPASRRPCIDITARPVTLPPD